MSDQSTASPSESSSSSQRPALRQLLPASQPQAAPASSSEDISRGLPHRRPQVPLACESCRRRKTKCNGTRPVCGPCQARNLDCEYRVQAESSAHLRRRLESLHESHPAAGVFRAIQTRPEHEALEIVHRIRAGADAESVLRCLSGADLLLQVRLAPETRNRFQFLYASEMPSYLQFASNAFTHSLLYEWNESGPLSPSDNKYKAQYLKPFHAATIVDARLEDIVPSRWTAISANDGLMRTLIHAYLLQEYDWFSFFHKDHFLDDMLAERDTFCSPLLVNAVLAAGCHSYNHLPHQEGLWSPNSLSHKFLTEAKRLWEAEVPDQRSLTSLQAALIMSAMIKVCDLSKLAVAYLTQSKSIAQRLGLFESMHHIQDQKLHQSFVFTAWAFFSWQSIFCYQLMIVPLFKTPPKTPLPAPDEQAEWYGEIWLKYPSGKYLVPLQYRQILKANAELAIILNQGVRNVSVGVARDQLAQNGAVWISDLIRALDVWHTSLPGLLAPSNVVFPSQLKLHLNYYHIQIQLYELLVAEKKTRPRSVPFETQDVQRALEESRAYFETILRIYYLRHSFEYGNMMLPQFLHVLAFLALAKLESLKTQTFSTSSIDLGDSDPRATRSTLFVAQKGLSDQGKGYYLPKTMFRRFLSRMAPEDLGFLETYIKVEQEEPEEAERRKSQLQGHCPLDVRAVAGDPQRQQPENWILKFAKLTLSEESQNSFLGIIPVDET